MDGSEDCHTTCCILNEICNQYNIFTNIDDNYIDDNMDTNGDVNNNNSYNTTPIKISNSHSNSNSNTQNEVNIQNEVCNGDVNVIEEEDIFIMDDLIFDNETNIQKKRNKRRSSGGENKRVSLGIE